MNDCKDCEQYCSNNICCTCRNREWYRLYKDYKHKEQQCKRLKEENAEIRKYQYEQEFLQEQLEAYKMEAEEGKEINAELKAENERLKKGIFKLDKTQPQVILTEGQVSLMYCTFLDMELKTTKLKQTLQEVKKMAEHWHNEWLNDIDERQGFEEILQKISEVIE